MMVVLGGFLPEGRLIDRVCWGRILKRVTHCGEVIAVVADSRDVLHGIWLEAFVELLRDDVGVRALEVSLDAPRGFSCHFESALENRLREVVDRH